MSRQKRVLTISLAVLLLVGVFLTGASLNRSIDGSFWNSWWSRETPVTSVTSKIVQEESMVIDIVETTSPAVVTIGISKLERFSTFNPFDPFSFFETQEQQVEQDIGTGFIVDAKGLIITNKHVVSDLGAQYRVISADNQTYEVQNIYRDPSNDLAILKIEAQNLPTVELGDSDSLRVGQFALAIGTALGEFRHTVTTGVISGLGRGIVAGSSFAGYVEELDNVIQTDAAINSGNSGGPLLNSAGQVIGVNVAVAQGAQNIGFAIPINIAKSMLDNFYQTGEFTRPFLGVRYSVITKEAAILNEIPEGAYVTEVISGSSAAEAGIQPGDIISEIDNQKIKDRQEGVAGIINQKKVGEVVTVKIWRDGETKEIPVRLKSQQ
ncbi:MAG: trypsin-like peptidase domain-containing protein [Candidatus Shapirobacteria bacterium]|nr:trypsin-like peptidase domain-containing protein [Candidatus Shapirobacteria bacterium]MDD5073760.1 trypsin-like peptidase domain-containing protein [Candidatus Shapirobacteria bacterium]MDD5481639.1 trypsin-like peptidase domain-containing protein [Candidatus Shapirobacteria bacterium]